MYREPARRDSSDGTPDELVYEWELRGGAQVTLREVAASVVAYGIAGAIGSRLESGGLAVVIALAVTGTLALRARRAWAREAVVLRVEDGALLVRDRGARAVKARIALRDLDVTLDTKTIRRVEEGRSAIPGVRYLDTRVGPEIDVSRIVLVERADDGERELALSEPYLAHLHATEGFGKIRVFLRRHGWVPTDEREEDGGDEEP